MTRHGPKFTANRKNSKKARRIYYPARPRVAIFEKNAGKEAGVLSALLSARRFHNKRAALVLRERRRAVLRVPSNASL